MLEVISAAQANRVAVTTAAVAITAAVQVPAYVVHRLPRVREAGSNQAERKRRARLLALLAALIRVSGLAEALDSRVVWPSCHAHVCWTRLALLACMHPVVVCCASVTISVC